MPFINAWQGLSTPVPGVWEAYIYVSNLDALFDEFRAADADICRPIERTVDGMRELEVRDPDSNVISFGEDTDPTMDYSSTNGPNSFIDIPRNWTTD